MDEVYLDEDEGDGAFGGPLTPPAAARRRPQSREQSLTLVKSRRPYRPTAPVTPPNDGGVVRDPKSVRGLWNHGRNSLASGAA